MGKLKQMPILMDTFIEWFEGQWSNQTQVFNDPKSASLVRVVHERTFENQFRCAYYIHKSRSPYRDMTFDLDYNDTDIHLTCGASKLIFSVVHGGFVCNTQQTIDGRTYIFKAYLRENYYRVNDQCFDAAGNLLRGLANDADFTFQKVRF